VRSYYVNDGDLHLVATSLQLVTRFLATGTGEKALGATKEFQHARSVMPLSRDDTVAAYLSDAFFQNITGPRYRVEMARRLQATADIELVRLAKLTAAAEQVPGTTIEDLVANGLLPQDFEVVPDGSRIILDGGDVRDSVRGSHGAFLPIPDTPVDKITRAELSDYEDFEKNYEAEWGRLDPMMACVKRSSPAKGQERVVVDVMMAPFAAKHFTRLREWLGEANQERLAAIPGDIANLQLVSNDQHVFAALRDIGPKPELPSPGNAAFARWMPLGRIRNLLEGYIGTTGELGILRFLNIGIPPRSDAAGYAGSPLGGWRRQYGPFTLFSFQHEVLDTVAPQLQFEKAPRPAQIRLKVGDISQARITPIVNDLGYARTRETSLNNVRLMQTLDQQLHVPPSACKEAAEFLLDAKLICPLGGKYELKPTPGGEPRWTSTLLEQHETKGLFRDHAPEGFQSPPLNWFRGLDLEATMTEKNISAHAEVLMQMPGK
jgi:hypothetical protein